MSIDKAQLEKINKKLTFDSSEKKDQHERQIQKLNEEISFLKQAMHQVKTDPNSASMSEAALRTSLVTLETKFREIRDKYAQKSKVFEELEFEQQQLKQTNDALKQELQAANEASINDRKDKHKIEMSLIETKNRLSEAVVGCRQLEDRLKIVTSENDYLKQENTKIEEGWKNEKRKCVGLERETEQLKYSGSTKEKEVYENVQGLTKQVTILKNENESLITRLEQFAVEAQSKGARDQKEIIILQQRLKTIESRESDLLLGIEDLQKKLAFYKDKLNSKDSDTALRQEWRDKLIMVLRYVRQIKESAVTEVFLAKQEVQVYGQTFLRLLEEYYQGIRPRQILRLQALQMQSAGTFGGLKQESKRSDNDSLGRSQRQSRKETLENGMSFAERSRQIFNKYVEESRQSLNNGENNTNRFESHQGFQPLKEIKYPDNSARPSHHTGYDIGHQYPDHEANKSHQYFQKMQVPRDRLDSIQASGWQALQQTPVSISKQLPPQPPQLQTTQSIDFSNNKFGFIPSNLKPLTAGGPLKGQKENLTPMTTKESQFSNLRPEVQPFEVQTMTKSKSVINHSYGYNQGFGEQSSNLTTPTKFGKYQAPEHYALEHHVQTGTFGNQENQTPNLLKPPTSQFSKPSQPSKDLKLIQSASGSYPSHYQQLSGLSVPSLLPLPHQDTISRPQSTRGDEGGSRIDISRIEKESEEITRRIQQLKQKDHKVVSVEIDYY